MAEILIYDEILPEFYWFGVSSMSVMRQLEEAGKTTEIDVRVNSPGGDVTEGLAILAALERHEGAVRIHIDSMAASAASLLSMVKSAEVIMGEYAAMMIHEPYVMAQVIHPEIDDLRDSLENYRNRTIAAYVGKSGQTAEQVTEWYNGWNGTYFDAEQAVEAGLADRVEKGTTEVEANVSGRIVQLQPPDWFAKKNRTSQSSRMNRQLQLMRLKR